VRVCYSSFSVANITVCVLLRATTLTRGERKSELQCLAQASRCIMICIIFLLKITLRKCFSSSVQHSLNILKYYRQKIISFVPSKLLIYCNFVIMRLSGCCCERQGQREKKRALEMSLARIASHHDKNHGGVFVMHWAPRARLQCTELLCCAFVGREKKALQHSYT